MSSAGKDVKQLDLSYIAGGNAKCYPLENSLGVFNKVKHPLTIWLRSPTLRYLPKRNKNLCSHAPTSDVNAYSCYIYNRPKLGAKEMAIRWWGIHPHHGTLLGKRKEPTADKHTGANPVHSARRKKTAPPGYKYRGSASETLSKGKTIEQSWRHWGVGSGARQTDRCVREGLGRGRCCASWL